MKIDIQEHLEQVDERADYALAAILKLGRKKIQAEIKAGNITVNDKKLKASYRIRENDLLEANITEEKVVELFAEKIEFDILHEDDDIMVINKPIDISVHPGAGEEQITLAHGLLQHYPPIKDVGEKERPGIVHRLDKNTAGLLIVAKTTTAYEKLKDMFKERNVEKKYYAVVEGEPKETERSINYKIFRDPVNRFKMKAFKDNAPFNAKEALTEYKTVSTFNHKSLLDVRIHTGRTHQIRVHLAAIGNPVIGDPLYNKKKNKKQLLFAYKLSFKHPINQKELTFFADLPKWTKPYLDQQANN